MSQSSYDEELVEAWYQQEASKMHDGCLPPSSGNPIPNNASFELSH